MSLEDITSKYEHPIIGVIGATFPLSDYDSEETRRLGYRLREHVEKGGSLFTGGVSGVGVDIYRGIVDYCLEKKIDDKFFVLLPDANINPDEEYSKIAEQKKEKILRIARLGKDMDERRSYLGAIADLLVVVNGSIGTIDEAVKGLLLGKRVLCLENTGGAAKVISKIKYGEIKDFPSGINLDLIETFNSTTELVDYLSNNWQK